MGSEAHRDGDHRRGGGGLCSLAGGHFRRRLHEAGCHIDCHTAGYIYRYAGQELLDGLPLHLPSQLPLHMPLRSTSRRRSPLPLHTGQELVDALPDE